MQDFYPEDYFLDTVVKVHAIESLVSAYKPLPLEQDQKESEDVELTARVLCLRVLDETASIKLVVPERIGGT